MSSWVIRVATPDIDESTEYFLAKQVGRAGVGGYYFVAQDIKGKFLWSQKPGIALWVLGNEKLHAFLKDHPEAFAVQIPGDADKRWRRRKKAL